MVLKPVVNNGMNYQPQLVLAGFLNHQQYGPKRIGSHSFSEEKLGDVRGRFRRQENGLTGCRFFLFCLKVESQESHSKKYPLVVGFDYS